MGCSSSLEVDNDDKCGLLNDYPWRTITIHEGYCNQITDPVVFQRNPYLESITVHKNSYMNVPAVTITNIINLVYLTIDESSFGKNPTLTIEGMFYGLSLKNRHSLRLWYFCWKECVW